MGRSWSPYGFSSLLVQGCVEEVTGPDQREVRKGLRKVPQRLAGRSDLLCVQAEMVGVGQHLLEILSGFLDPSRPRQGFDIPETTDAKRPLSPFEPVVCCLLDAIAIDMRPMRQLLLNAIKRLEHTRIGRSHQAGQREQ